MRKGASYYLEFITYAVGYGQSTIMMWRTSTKENIPAHLNEKELMCVFVDIRSEGTYHSLRMER